MIGLFYRHIYINTIVAMLLGMNSGVALQWATVSDTSSQGLLQFTNAKPSSALMQNIFTLALHVLMSLRRIRMTQPRMPFTTKSTFCITPDPISKFRLVFNAKVAQQSGNIVCTRTQATMASNRYPLIISSTWFQHRNIHKATRQSSDLKNQIDHVVIDGRYASSIFDLRTLRGGNMDSKNFDVAAMLRATLVPEEEA